MFRMALSMAFALCLLIPSNGIAQPRQPKKKPDTVKLQREDTQFKEGEKVEITRLVPVMEAMETTARSEGNPKSEGTSSTALRPTYKLHKETSFIILPPRRWMIGADGWFDEEGYNITQLREILSSGRLSDSALRSIKYMDKDGRELRAVLEPGDVIKSINGYPTTSLVQLYYAVNGAPNPRDLAIEWINSRNGDVLTGRVSAVKVAP